MATKKAAASMTAADLKALATDLGVPVKEGKLTAVRDRFFVTIGQTRQELKVGEVVDAAALKPLVGQPISVIAVKRNIVAIAAANWKPPIIVCYIPVPELIKAIRQDLRISVLKGMVDKQIITPALQERLIAGK